MSRKMNILASQSRHRCLTGELESPPNGARITLYIIVLAAS